MSDRIAMLSLAVSLFGILIAILALYFGSDTGNTDDDRKTLQARRRIAIAMGFGFCLLAGVSIGVLVCTPTAPPQQAALTPASAATALSCVSTPPIGLEELAADAGEYWSRGIWGSPTVSSFTTGMAIVDTDDPDFSTFQIWLDPCLASTVPGHGYVTGARFWSLDSQGGGGTSQPLIIGEVATVSLPRGTGRWGLGNQQ